MSDLKTVTIDISQIANGLKLIIDEHKENTFFDYEDALTKGEARYQMIEGCFYDYEFKDPTYYFVKTDYIQPNTRKPHMGVIAPNIYVGTLTLQISKKEEPEWKGFIRLEVQSIKTHYRTDYRYMLESITEKCTELIMQIDSPVTQRFVTNFDVDSQTLYQRFSFVKSIVDSKEIEEAIQMIVTHSTTKWETETEEKDIRNIRRFGQRDIQQFVSRSNRIALPVSHFLHQNYGISSIPARIESIRKTESVDTSENRFIKYALQEFLFFCENCEDKFEKYSRSKLEAKALSDKLSGILNNSFFKEISRPDSLKLNSPVLQRKSGYREVLNAWLKYDLAAKLIWEGGDDVYEAGKKDIATLYEYWLFFTLLDLLREVFKIEPRDIHKLIKFDKDKLSLNLKQGKTIALKGEYDSPNRKLNIEFSYNKSFGGGSKYPAAGSWTTTLRPDYTLSVWPTELTHNEAELNELITHIHFDAKYKVNNFYELVNTQNDPESLDNVKKEEKKGNFKNADLLKMHAYKDAIRRTSGAYILYPGEGKNKPFRGFHEIIPGLGAFVLKPDKDETGKEDLKDFIINVVDHFLDRASQRENTASKAYDIHKDKKKDKDILNSPMPEYINGIKLIPDETTVLVGYYKSPEHLKWISENSIYNFRTGFGSGSLGLSEKELGAKFIVLHGDNNSKTKEIYKLKEIGPKIYSKQNLIDKLYPTAPSGDLYIMFEIEKEMSEEFGNSEFDLTKLDNFKNFRQSSKPITVTLSKLLKTIVS